MGFREIVPCKPGANIGSYFVLTNGLKNIFLFLMALRVVPSAALSVTIFCSFLTKGFPLQSLTRLAIKFHLSACVLHTELNISFSFPSFVLTRGAAELSVAKQKKEKLKACISIASIF